MITTKIYREYLKNVEKRLCASAITLCLPKFVLNSRNIGVIIARWSRT